MTIRPGSWLVSAGLVLVALGVPGRPAAEVTVSVSLPRLVVVVGTGVRYCDDCDEDVFYFGNVWYVYRSGGWYRRSAWGSPWIFVRQGRLPEVFTRVPPGRFKHRYGGRHPAYGHYPRMKPPGERRDERAESGRGHSGPGDDGSGQADKSKNKKKKARKKHDQDGDHGGHGRR